MDKDVYRGRLEVAVLETNRIHPNFLGMILCGSFFTEKEKPSDIDLIPVLGNYDGDWQLQADEEGCYDDAYYLYLKMERYFGSHFYDLVGDREVMFKTYRKKDGLFHIESLVALDDLPFLRERLGELVRDGVDPKKFIGIEYARQTLLDCCS